MMKKTAENYQNCYVTKKPIVSKISKISLPNSMNKFQIAQIKDLNEDCVEISRPYLLYFLRNKPSNSVTIGLGMADSASLIINFTASAN